MAKKEDVGMFDQAQQPATQPQTTESKPKTAPAIHPDIIKAGLVPFIMQPKQAYIAAMCKERPSSTCSGSKECRIDRLVIEPRVEIGIPCTIQR